MTSRDYNGLTYTIIDATTASVKATNATSAPAIPTIESSIEIPLASGTFYTVTTVAKNGFLYNQSITHITLPDSITTIGFYAFEQTEISEINISKYCVNIGNAAFIYNNIVPISINIPSDTTIDIFPDDAFMACIFLNPTFTIPNSVTTLGSQCFYGCTNLTTLNGGNNVTSLGSSCFSYCRKLSFPSQIQVSVYLSNCFDNFSSFENSPAYSEPNETIIAPVKVAKSIINFGLNFFSVNVKASAKTNLPSASVFNISIVLPL